jgi:murein DD-endopeptidase MepM/ murein hydrolase activator NlpD
MFVKKGDTIHKGQAIGKVGNSGVVTGQHLHYEIRYEDQHINPEKFLSFSR